MVWFWRRKSEAINTPPRCGSGGFYLPLTTYHLPLSEHSPLIAHGLPSQTNIFPASETPAPSTASGRIISSWAAPEGIIG